MSKADKMFKELGYDLIESPDELEPIDNDYYRKDDVVFEFTFNGKITLRIYFVDKQIGFNYPEGYCAEISREHHHAINLKSIELWGVYDE